MSRDDVDYKEMGPELFFCRPAGMRDFERAVDAKTKYWDDGEGGFRGLIYMGIFLAALSIAGVSVPWVGIVTALLFIFLPMLGVLWVAMKAWRYLSKPEEDYFIVYEKGIRWRIPGSRSKKGKVLYDELAKICYKGQPEGEVPEGEKTGDLTLRMLGKLWDLAGEGGMMFIYQNMKVKILENVFLRFEEEDLREAMGYLEAHHGELVRSEGSVFSVMRRLREEKKKKKETF